MSKGLEALDNLLNDKLVKPDKYHKTIRDMAVAIIQTELIVGQMDYEETKKDLKKVMNDYQDLGNSVYKPIKALEIIKNKNVNVNMFISICNFRNGFEKYNELILRQDMTGKKEKNLLIQEEWNLLKEVLL